MTAGELRERVRFERRLEAGDDGYGNVQFDWQKIAGPMAARLKPSRGSEEVLAQRLAGVAPFEIRVRWCAETRAIASGDRCVDERTGTIYNIRSTVNLDEHRRYIDITADAGVAT